MDKKSTELLQERGYTVYNKQRFRGTTKGFFIDCLLGDDGSSEVIINCYLAGKENEVASALDNLRKSKIIMNFFLRGNTIHLLTGSAYAFGHAIALDKTFRSIDECIATLENLGISSNDCPICGKSMEITETAICPNGMTAHKECANQMKADIIATPNNYAKGCLGAMLGVLVGCIVWVVAFFFGFLTTIAPIVAAFLASILWDKFGGKNDTKKIVLIVILTFIGFLITLCALYGFAIMSRIIELSFDGTFFEGVRFIFLYDNEFRTALLQDVTYSLIFCIAGIVFAVIDIVRKQKLTK